MSFLYKWSFALRCWGQAKSCKKQLLRTTMPLPPNSRCDHLPWNFSSVQSKQRWGLSNLKFRNRNLTTILITTQTSMQSQRSKSLKRTVETPYFPKPFNQNQVSPLTTKLHCKNIISNLPSPPEPTPKKTPENTRVTPRKFNIVPKNRQSQKETESSNHQFSGASCWVEFPEV